MPNDTVTRKRILHTLCFLLDMFHCDPYEAILWMLYFLNQSFKSSSANCLYSVLDAFSSHGTSRNLYSSYLLACLPHTHFTTPSQICHSLQQSSVFRSHVPVRGLSHLQILFVHFLQEISIFHLQIVAYFCWFLSYYISRESHLYILTEFPNKCKLLGILKFYFYRMQVVKTYAYAAIPTPNTSSFHMFMPISLVPNCHCFSATSSD